ncbi:hypothetical protein SKP52_02450 [Sphingopyxis fribergensis]|uniref:TonB C-terminal domain-containing protein n=2 Tax=Sphingopyxis fribergensis TaxID=1515612 RepID=A0A0A7PBQ4_9SPHN|nr:hypothetical protein SKP52_02450 [Sphingopyxis fribergensis]
MRRGIVALVTALGISTPAQASWEVIRGDGACAISAQWDDDGGTRATLVEMADGAVALGLQNSNWSIKEGEIYPLTVAFDRDLYSVKATGFSDSEGRGFRFSAGRDLAVAFGAASSLIILRDGGNPTTVLAVKLIGSRAAIERMKPCMATVRREKAREQAAADALQRKRDIVPADPFFEPEAAIPIGNAGRWATNDDYPAAAMRERREGDAQFKVTVDRLGAPTDCEIISSSGHADLDAATCSLVLRRSRFNTAPDTQGSRFYRNRIRWRVPVYDSAPPAEAK